MITCPAMVPTVEEESPDRSSASPKAPAESDPSSGLNVRCASSMLATCCPL